MFQSQCCVDTAARAPAARKKRIGREEDGKNTGRRQEEDGKKTGRRQEEVGKKTGRGREEDRKRTGRRQERMRDNTTTIFVLVQVYRILYLYCSGTSSPWPACMPQTPKYISSALSCLSMVFSTHTALLFRFVKHRVVIN